ncbi:uncharacterized protein LOC128895146 [Hylaeus anthracinus]|uniref:uncharacterized protein LOC128895146 n=1 Tax=Hylaeus anthracinus TaxID=313031 RepID=UPI0023B9C1B4|nr:uncharacterized protein LOC128895146 [Hylaeus anthracinus]
MTMTEEEQYCHDDNDCSSEQYCYDISGRCVEYTQCSRYNRRENEKRSRHPSQCGECLPGYAAEELGTGEMALLCRKTGLHKTESEPANVSNDVTIYTLVGVSFLCLVLLVTFLLRRRYSKRRDIRTEECSDLCVVKPTAPPMESKPFISCGEGIVINNNKHLKDKNRLVCAGAFKAPSWVRPNPNCESNSHSGDVSAMDQMHTSVELPPADDNANMWVPRQLPLTIVNGNIAQLEQVNNNVDTIRRNNPSSSNAGEEGTSNSSNDSASESNNGRDGREHNQGSNILITQTMSMNVNVLNCDY